MLTTFTPFWGLHKDFERFFGGFAPWLKNTPSAATAGKIVYPLINLRDDENNIYVHAEVPGLEIGDLDVAYEDGVLTIKGERKPEEGNYLFRERPEGLFVRIVNVAWPINPDAVTAALKDGLLTVTLPKAEAAKPRKIAIQ